MIIRLINKSLRRANGHAKGFTLLELMIVIGIIAIIGTVVYIFFTNITKKSTAERTASQVQQKTRLAVDLITRDIRMMGLDPTGHINSSFFDEDGCGHGISTRAGNDHIFINVDLDYDGLTNSEFERIGYWYDSTNNNLNITFWDGSAWICDVLVDNVDNFEITYLNANMNPITPPSNGANIVFVTVNISMKERRAGESGDNDDTFVIRTYTETVRIRNPQ